MVDPAFYALIEKLAARAHLSVYCDANNARRALGLPLAPIAERINRAFELSKPLYG